MMARRLSLRGRELLERDPDVLGLHLLDEVGKDVADCRVPRERAPVDEDSRHRGGHGLGE